MLTSENVPLLSVIVTVKNSNHLEKCFESIVNSASEKFESLQLIIIDDVFEDNIDETRRYPFMGHSNVNYHRVNFRNIGKVKNFALNRCAGEYVTIIDSNDEFLPLALFDISLMLITQKPDILLTKLNQYCKPSLSKKQRIGKGAYLISQHEAIIKFLVNKDVQGCFHGQFIKREIIAGMNFPEFYCYEDFYLFPHVLVKCKLIIFSRNRPYFYLKRKENLPEEIDCNKIDFLLRSTEQLKVCFGSDHENLILSHWVNIQHRHYFDISNKIYRMCISENLSRISFYSFITDARVRLSSKMKLLKLLLIGEFE